eukprot:20530_1
MAEEKKSDEKKFKYEDLINIELELVKRKNMIEIALSDIDNTWTKHKTGDDNISVAYKQFADSAVYTTRGETTFKGDIEFYYKSSECGYDDVYIDAMKDSDTTENNIRKLIDKDHQIVYLSNKSGYMVLSPRDFTYVRTRFKLKNYTFKNKKYKTIVGNMGYSVPENHPCNVAVKKNHVRATIILSGHVVSVPEDFEDGMMKVCYILAMDPNGMIPSWVVNQFACKKGMNVKNFAPNWEGIQKRMKKREESNWEKQHKVLFEPHPKLTYIEEQVEQNDENKENDNDNKDT